MVLFHGGSLFRARQRVGIICIHLIRMKLYTSGRLTVLVVAEWTNATRIQSQQAKTTLTVFYA